MFPENVYQCALMRSVQEGEATVHVRRFDYRQNFRGLSEMAMTGHRATDLFRARLGGMWSSGQR
jgi:hypothetical protein